MAITTLDPEQSRGSLTRGGGRLARRAPLEAQFGLEALDVAKD